MYLVMISTVKPYRSETEPLLALSPKLLYTTPCPSQVVMRMVPRRRPSTGHIVGSGDPLPDTVCLLYMSQVNAGIVHPRRLYSCWLAGASPSQACPQAGTRAADTGPMGPDDGPRMSC